MTTANDKIIPFSLKNSPALIEVVFPAQKVSFEASKEREGRQSQTLTALGSYWKGRKPLILNKACILGAILPATKNLRRDLEIFEMLMGMDDLSFAARLGHREPKDIVAKIELSDIENYFDILPQGALPQSAPFIIAQFAYEVKGKKKVPTISWKKDVPAKTRRRLEAKAFAFRGYKSQVEEAARPESCSDLHDHIWDEVNEHLGTEAASLPDLIEQLGIMRFGRRPRVADTFCGSGQIPFEAARLGCDVYASDLNPVSCMLTWGGFNVVGATPEKRASLIVAQNKVVETVRKEIEALGIESDGNGWTAKAFLYCLETTCTQSGWTVPLLPTLVASKGHGVVAKLLPNKTLKRYDIEIVSNATPDELKAAEQGTLQDGSLVHEVDGVVYRSKISTLRGDYTAAAADDSKETKNRLRLWGKADVTFRDDDIFRERLYAVQWQKEPSPGRRVESVFRTVTVDDLEREKRVLDHVQVHLAEWQKNGWVPDMVIEKGDETERLYKERGWTHWHHLFNPRQLFTACLFNRHTPAELKFAFSQLLNMNSRLSRWNYLSGVGQTAGVFDNQALNTLYNYGCRGFEFCKPLFDVGYKSFPLPIITNKICSNHPATQIEQDSDIYVTDPPYGDAVKYEEILEFFIAWMRKNPPKEFANWTWDSRRSLAVKGEDHDFKLAMVAAYKAMGEKMPDNGIQVLMFTHQSGTIWADIANIVWASGLRVSAAWYVVTETDSALREGSYVKGTVLLVLRKRLGQLSTFRDDLAMELEDEVKDQVATLTGLNQGTRDLYRDENLFADSDLQMAGYAAALRVLTRYAVIDGVDMTVEALRPRENGKGTRVDKLIEYAVEIANQCLIPSGIQEARWRELKPGERFYLKMLDMESHGHKALENYQNFAKAFKVRNFKPFMASQKANSARLYSATEFGRAEMAGESELAGTPLRAALYAMMELGRGTESEDVLSHLADNLPDYLRKRDTVAAIADFMASRLPSVREDEASNARVLRDLVRNERLA